MLDLDRISIPIDCPSCSFANDLLMREIRLGMPVLCRGCNGTLRVDDHMNSMRTSVRNINAVLASLREQFNQTFTIDINI